MGFSGLTPVGATARPEQRATRACRRAIAGSATVLGLMGRQLSLGSAPHPECQQTLRHLMAGFYLPMAVKVLRLGTNGAGPDEELTVQLQTGLLATLKLAGTICRV